MTILDSRLFYLIACLNKFTSSNSFQLRSEEEPLTFTRCQQHDLKIWHTKDKATIIYSHYSDSQIQTEEALILLNPRNEAEKDLGEYFLKREFPFYINYFLDDAAFVGQYQSNRDHEKWKRILRHVSSWMLEHKYLETDPRAFSKFAELPADRFLQRVNYRHFPVPVIQDFHPVVQEQCEKGLLYCLKLVHEYAFAHMEQFNKFLNSESSMFLKKFTELAKSEKKSANLALKALYYANNDFCAAEGDLGWTWHSSRNLEPFLSLSDLFEFRTTASYYLCNYTLAQKAQYGKLGYPGTPEDYWAYVGTGKYKALECLYPGADIPRLPVRVFRKNGLAYTLASMDGFQCNKVGFCKIPIYGKVGQKWKDDFAFSDFSCSLMAFCPDPCCGAFKNPLEDPQDIDNCKKGNSHFPCDHGAENGGCSFDDGKNGDFFGLIQNRINITCGCNEKNGRRWDSSLGICMDIDECEEKNPCHKQLEVCVNMLSGENPLCVCEFGLKRNTVTMQCERDGESGLFVNLVGDDKKMNVHDPLTLKPNTQINGHDIDNSAAFRLALKQTINFLHSGCLPTYHNLLFLLFSCLLIAAC